MIRAVRVVVVAFHAAGELENCLDALGGSFPVTVVDNSSSAAVESVARRVGMEYLDPGVNLGFAAGVNRALCTTLEGSPADVLLLNPDARLDATDVERLASYLHRPENVRLAAVAPRLLGARDAEQRVVWPFPGPGRAWLDAVGLARIPSRRTFVTGAALLLRWEALQEVGPFDEGFFLYAEEADWQRRAHILGWSSALCNEVTGWHLGGGTSTNSRRREELFHAGQETYIRKWHGALGWGTYRMAVLVGAAVRSLVLTGDRRHAAARRAALYARGPRRAAGLSRS